MMRWTCLPVFFLLFTVACAPKPDFSQVKEKVVLKHPIVLVHGASMGGAYLRIGPLNLGYYFQYIPEYLFALGNQKIAVPHLSTDSSIAERAILLKNYIAAKFPSGEKVNIIAHSMGGLDARFLVAVLKSNQVASITCIATPNRGSPLADWAYDQTQGRKFWYWVLRVFGYDLKYRRFLPELRTEYMQNTFNPKVPDSPKVKYYSVESTGEFGTWSLSPLLYLPYWFLRAQKSPMSQDPSDGLVPLSSQAWGRVIGRVQLDHLAEINHHTFRPWNGEASLAMYSMIVHELAKDGL